MKITIQYFDGCPHWKLADERVQSVLRGLARDDVSLAHQLIDSPEDATRFGFHGSPTILIDGRDAFATGAQQIGRLTNLMQLTVDTSYWTRYRSSTQNPDLGGTFPPAVPGLLNGKFPAIPRNNADVTGPADHLQAIANTAGFHFGYIEQGGSSLYPTLAQQVTNPEVLRILLSIGPTETSHFQTWHDKAGNAKVRTGPTNGLVFPDLNASGSPDTQTNLIMPEPTVFIRGLPAVSIIRPTLVEGSGAAVATVKSFAADGLFIGQSPQFVPLLLGMAEQADEARRGFLR